MGSVSEMSSTVYASGGAPKSIASYLKCRSRFSKTGVVVVVVAVVDSVFLLVLQASSVVIVDVQSFLLLVNSTLMFSKMSVRLLVAGGVDLVKVTVVSNV